MSFTVSSSKGAFKEEKSFLSRLSEGIAGSSDYTESKINQYSKVEKIRRHHSKKDCCFALILTSKPVVIPLIMTLYANTFLCEETIFKVIKNKIDDTLVTLIL